jgi:hypothetical protein
MEAEFDKPVVGLRLQDKIYSIVLAVHYESGNIIMKFITVN